MYRLNHDQNFFSHKIRTGFYKVWQVLCLLKNLSIYKQFKYNNNPILNLYLFLNYTYLSFKIKESLLHLKLIFYLHHTFLNCEHFIQWLLYYILNLLDYSLIFEYLDILIAVQNEEDCQRETLPFQHQLSTLWSCDE